MQVPTVRWYETLLKGGDQVYLLIQNFGQFPCSWIQIRIPNADSDPGEPVNADPNTKDLFRNECQEDDQLIENAK